MLALAAISPAAPDSTGSDAAVPGPRSQSMLEGSTNGASAAPVALDDSAAANTDVEGLPIHRVEITALNVFEPVPPGRLAWLYRLGNRVHIRTRKRTIREQLLFAAGDRWTEARAKETERNLRALNYLTPERIDARRRADSAHVEVVTRDIWSTSPEFNLESADGKQYGSVAYTDRNFLGLGKSFSLVYREDPSGSSRLFSLDDPNVMGSRIRLHYGASNGASSAVDQVNVGLPFYAEDAPLTYGVSLVRATSEVHLYERALEAAHLDEGLEETEVFGGWGRRRDGLVERLTLSFLARDRRLSATRLEPGASPEFAAAEKNLRLRVAAADIRWWRPEFVERTNVNQMALIEDFDLGTSLAVKIGMSPRMFGSTADEGFARAGLDVGTDTPLGFGWVRANTAGRFRRDLRELISRVDARWIAQTPVRHTIALAAFGASGWRTDQDFQLVVGGLNGLRAYPVQAVTGQRVVRLNFEDRWALWQNVRDLLAIGVVGFSDAAHAWGTGSAGAGWFCSAGVGVRLSLPRWSPNQILRVDVGWPISPTRDGRREPVLSFGSSQAF